MSSLKRITLLFIISLLMSSCDSSKSSYTSILDFIDPSWSLIYTIDEISQVEKDLQDNVLIDQMSSTRLQQVLRKYPFIGKLPFTSEIAIALPGVKDTTNNALVITKFQKAKTKDSLQKTNTPTKEIVLSQVAQDSIYQVQLGDYILYSGVKKWLEKAKSQEKNQDQTLAKLMGSNAFKGISVYFKNNAFLGSKDVLTSWSGLDLTLVSKGVQGSGIAMIQDSLHILSVFKGQKAHEFSMASMIPNTALRGRAIGYSNARLLQQNITVYKKDSTQIAPTEVFETLKSIGQIVLSNGEITLMESLDSQLTLESLAKYISRAQPYRDILLYTCNAPSLVANTYSPLLEGHQMNVIFSIENYIVGASTMEVAQQYINAIETGNTLAETSYFKNVSEQLPTTCSLFVFEQQHTAGFSKQAIGDKATKQTANDFPIAIFQYKYDTSFAHINFINHKAGKEIKKAKGVTQLVSIDVGKTILGDPQFFTNHKTNEKEIVVQDTDNKLHLFALSGNKLWSKALENPILGSIVEIDLLANGKKQLAFATKNKLHVLDRNGKQVAPFPVTFRDQITQPLAVFDYDNTKKYRFVIIQDNEVVMLDKKGKTVKGFTFKKAKSNIIGMAQHIRLQNKDYLLFQQENGTLSILSRTGKERVRVAEKLNLTGAPVLKTKTNFVLVTKDNQQKTISQKGKITSKKINTPNEFALSIVRDNIISLSDNHLRVNSKHIELPFGIYTTPSVYYANKKGYITTTETQEKKTYLYNFEGELLKGFPVYGVSSAEVIASKKNVFIVTKEDDTKCIVYQVK
jgi:hypothetical protein